MPINEKLKVKVCEEIDKRREEIIGIAKTILENPELGFGEVKTARLVSQKFAELGILHRAGLGITGIKGVVNGGDSGPSVGVMGELDSLIVPEHPYANKENGAAHACGHNAQIAILYGVAAAITQSGILPALTGKVVFFAVPAEERIEIDYRSGLIKQGKLHYLTGKPELISLGEMDDIDIAMMTHTSPELGTVKLARAESWNGNVAKRIQFIGKSAHAGGQPHKGVNALNAAMIALTAIHAQRETFQDADTIRVHPIITRGGAAVNAVPADVRIETYVRGKSTKAFLDANEKVDRALRAGAMAIGAKVKITTIPGGMPFVTYSELWNTYESNAAFIVGKEGIGNLGHKTSSSDFGDVSQIMPAIHPFSGGITGTPHGSDYLISDYEVAVINPAKAIATTIIDLLADGANKAREVLSKSKPPMTKEQYLKSLDSLFREEEYQG